MTKEQRKALKRAISLSNPLSLDSAKAKLPEKLPKESVSFTPSLNK